MAAAEPRRAPAMPFTERIALAWHEAGNFAAGRLVAATRQNDDDRATFWTEAMNRCDDQADLLEALMRKGWL